MEMGRRRGEEERREGRGGMGRGREGEGGEERRGGERRGEERRGEERREGMGRKEKVKRREECEVTEPQRHEQRAIKIDSKQEAKSSHKD